MVLHRRPATDDDRTFLRGLHASTRDDLAGLGLPDAALAPLMEQQWQAQSQGHAARFPDAADWILLDEHGPVGRLLVDRDDARIHIVDVALLSAARGQGSGAEVIRAVQDEAAPDGLPVTLSVLVTNVQARRFYARLGFVEVEDLATHLALRWDPPPA